MTGLLVLFLFTPEPVLIYLSIAILIHIALNLNPFLKYDGYWILSDLMQVPNLRKRSQQIMKASLKLQTLKQLTPINIFLLIYGIFSSAIIVIFLLATLYFDSGSILNFPVSVYNFVTTSSPTHYWKGFGDGKLIQKAIPLLFYIFVGRLLLRSIRSYFQNKKQWTDPS